MDVTPDLLDLETVAERTSLTHRYVQFLVASGQLGSVKVGRRRLVPRHAFEAWLASLEGRAA